MPLSEFFFIIVFYSCIRCCRSFNPFNLWRYVCPALFQGHLACQSGSYLDNRASKETEAGAILFDEKRKHK